MSRTQSGVSYIVSCHGGTAGVTCREPKRPVGKNEEREKLRRKLTALFSRPFFPFFPPKVLSLQMTTQ